METQIKIFKKLLEFQTKIETIKKDGQNTFFKKSNGKSSTYATLPNILEQVKPILNGIKLVITQPIINNEVLTIITDADSGESIKSGVMLTAGLSAQQTGSAITYFRRYTLSSLLSLEIDEDDDGNKASQPVAKKEEKTEAKTKPYLNENSVQFTEAVAFLKGEGTIEKIKTKYQLSEHVESLLKEVVLS